MQPTAMAAPRPQCDCTAMQRLPSHCQCSRLSRTPTSRSTETAMRLHCHAADCHGSTETAMRLHCHAATAIALPVQPTVSHTDEPEHRDRNATALPCSRLPWQHRDRNATALSCSDCHSIASAADCLAHRRAGAPRPQCDCTAMQPLPSHCQCRRLSRTPTSRSTETAMRLHCHAADCHGSTETAMRLHCHAATAIALPVQPTVSHTDEPGSTETAMRLHCHAADCHG